VIQNPSCLGHLVSLGSIKDIELEYKSAAFSVSVDMFFKNNELLICPIEKCYIAKAGSCKTPYISNNIKISAKPPVKVSSISTFVKAGWEEKICFACQNKAETVTYDNWSIT
jgi:hypothetical protein